MFNKTFNKTLIAAAVAMITLNVAQARTLAVPIEGETIAATPTTVQIGETLESVSTRLQGFELNERVALADGAKRIDYLVVRANSGADENPALIFEDGTLTRIVTAGDRKAFSACRTLATSRGGHWMQAGFEPYRALLVGGAESVALAPPSTDLSVVRVVNDTTDRGMQAVETITGLVPTAFNPSAVPKTLRNWVRTARELRETNERADVLRKMPVGMDETALVRAIGVDWARVEKTDPLLWYRKEGFEVLIHEGRVAGVEFPGRRERLEKAAGSYYEPGVDWSRCPQ